MSAIPLENEEKSQGFQTEKRISGMVGVPMGRKIRLGDCTLQPFLHDPEPNGGKWTGVIEEMYRVEICWDTGEVKRWTFDDVKWWLNDMGVPRRVYDQLVGEAVVLYRKLFAGGSA